MLGRNIDYEIPKSLAEGKLIFGGSKQADDTGDEHIVVKLESSDNLSEISSFSKLGNSE